MAELRRRTLGRTGLVVGELGLGGAHLASGDFGEETLLTAFSLGIDFVETGRSYKGSEFLIGRALAQWANRSAVHIASKTLARSRDGALHDLDRSLQHLGLTAVDVYQLNDVGEEDWPKVMSPGGALEGLREAREQGTIRFIGISSHSLSVLRRAVESDEFDTVQAKWGAFHVDSAGLLRLAHSHDIGVIGMKPFGGFGMFGSLKGSEFATKLSPSVLLSFALSNRHLSVCIPGMRSPQEVRGNVAQAGSRLAMDAKMRARVAKQARDFLAAMRSSP
jgi:uncharacterized protein